MFFRCPPRSVPTPMAARPQHHQQQPNGVEEDAPGTPSCEAAATSAAAAVTAVTAALTLEDHTDGVVTATASSGSDSGSNSSTASGSSSPSRISKGSGASAVNGAAGGGKGLQAAAAGSDAADGVGAGGWGLVALVPIRAGEVVQRNEQRPVVLASSGFVKRSWPVGSRQREWFEAYAYPIGDEVRYNGTGRGLTPPRDHC